jgi:hypothetical protein
MDIIKTEQDTACTDGNCNGKCNFNGIQKGTESNVKTGCQLSGANWGDSTVVKDVQLITANEERVSGMKGELHPTESHLLRLTDDFYGTAKLKDKPVVRNGVCLITVQGKGPLQPGKEEVSIAVTL